MWAVLVQVNNLLWEEGESDVLASIVYAINLTSGATDEGLREVARRLFDLDGAVSDDPALQEVIHHVSDYQSRPCNLFTESGF